MTKLRWTVLSVFAFFYVFVVSASNYISFADDLVNTSQTAKVSKPKRSQLAKFTRLGTKKSSPITQNATSPSVSRTPTSAKRTGEGQEGLIPSNWFEKLDQQLTYDTFEINPRVRTEYLLDSNVFLDSKDAKMDSIFRESPGVQVVIPFADHYFKADYYVDFEQFMKYPRENAQNQYLASEAALNFTNSFIHVNQRLSKTSSRSGTQFTERVPRFEQDVDTSAGYKFNHTTVRGGYDYFYRSFDSEIHKSLNYHAHKFYSGVAVETGPKTNVTLDYAFTDYDYTKDSRRDGLGNEIFVGFAGHFLPKTSFFSRFGYERISYDQATDANNFVAAVSTNYRSFAKTNIDFGWTRSTEQSTFSTTNFFRQDLLFLKMKQGFTEKVLGTFDVSYAKQDYEQEGTAGNNIFVGRKRDDNLFSTGVKFSYLINEWVTSDIAYQYSRRNSNASVFDYTDHLITLGLTAKV